MNARQVDLTFTDALDVEVSEASNVHRVYWRGLDITSVLEPLELEAITNKGAGMSAMDIIEQQQGDIDRLRAEVGRLRGLLADANAFRAELSALLGCSSDGHAELDRIRYLIEPRGNP